MLIENQLKKLGFGAAAIFLLIVAMLLGAAQMYLMSAILALVPVGGWLLNRVMMQGLTCDRLAPDTADEHARSLVTVTVENNGWLPKMYVRLLDRLPRYMRYAGTPPGDSAFVTTLWPGESCKLSYYMEPQKRGLHVIGPLDILATDVLGFSNSKKTIETTKEVLVYPEVLPVSPNLLSSGPATGWRDEHDARNRGSGTDFTGVREYRPGDELRRINWKTTARTGALAVTEYTQGYANDVAIVLDREAAIYEGSGEGVASAFEYGIKIVAALGAASLRRGSALQMSLSASEPDRLVEMKGYLELPLLLERLARAEADGTVSVIRQMELAMPEIESGATVVVITPRPLDDPEITSALEAWRRGASSTTLHLFWLDGPSFTHVSTGRRAGDEFSYLGQTAGLTHKGQRTERGVEYIVQADTNLISLLGGASEIG